MHSQSYLISPPKSIGGIQFEELQLRAYADSPDKLKCILLRDHSSPVPEACLTVNLPQYQHILKPFEYFIKDYSENVDIVRQFADDKILVHTRQVVPSGHVQIPVYRLDLTKLSDHLNCGLCRKTFPSAQMVQSTDPEGLYCQTCADALEGDFDVSVDFSAVDNADVDVPKEGR